MQKQIQRQRLRHTALRWPQNPINVIGLLDIKYKDKYKEKYKNKYKNK